MLAICVVFSAFFSSSETAITGVDKIKLKTLVDQGNSRALLLNLLLKDPRCKFLGQIQNKNLLKKMRESHIFLLPSLFEGFGQVLLEALSCGLPLITTNNTAGLDIIDDDKNGFLTPIRDTKKTINIIHNLYQNEELRLSIADNGFTRASDFSWTKYQNEVSKIIKS